MISGTAANTVHQSPVVPVGVPGSATGSRSPNMRSYMESTTLSVTSARGICRRRGTARTLPVLRVLEVVPAAGVPAGPLVAVGRDAARVLQHAGQVEQVPRHEGGVAVGEVVLGSARALVEVA